jgi:hypothetical protein
LRRWVEPSIVVFTLALVASLGIHLPAYEALGVLAKHVLHEEPSRPPTTVEFNVGEPESSEQATPPDEPDEARKPDSERPDPPDREEPKQQQREPQRPEKQERPTKQRRQKKKEKSEKQKKKKKKRQQIDPVQKHAITQQTDDSDEAPEDARFVSEQSNRVEEQTVARQTNLVRDDPEPSPGAPEEPSEAQEPGNADETRVAQMRKKQGTDVRTPTPQEAEQQRPDEASEEPPPPSHAGGDGISEGQRVASRERPRPERSTDRSRESQPAPEPREQVVTVRDSFGTLRIRKPRESEARRTAPDGQGQGRPQQDGSGQIPDLRRGRRGEGRGAERSGPDRRFAWSDLQQMYGREKLEKERETYIEERRSQQRGSSRKRRWKEFKAAIENYVPNVKPGNQTALNAAASPFANYIANFHRRLHPEFSGKFLDGLPSYSASPFADRTLKTKLEIIVNQDGTVHRVGVIETSGFMPFDYGAFASVMRAQPYPEAPQSVLSGDGRVYLHWGFYRNRRQCGTFNAEPYILPDPPGTPDDQGGPLQDKPSYGGGVVPEGAQPSWKEGEGQGGSQNGGDDSGGGEGSSGQGGEGEGAPPPERRRRPEPNDASDDSERQSPPRTPPSPGTGAAMG